MKIPEMYIFDLEWKVFFFFFFKYTQKEYIKKVSQVPQRLPITGPRTWAIPKIFIYIHFTHQNI